MAVVILVLLNHVRSLVVVVLAGLFSAACSSAPIEPVLITGHCATDTTVDCDVSFAMVGSTPMPAGLIGYSCSSNARPDQSPSSSEGVPSGLVCAAKGANGAGNQTFCCSPNSTPCAYDPVLSCDVGTDGYECLGADRPEALNPAIQCGNGVQDGNYIDYCCSGEKQPAGCVQVDTLGCSERLTGFSCPGTALPKAEQLGASESRADYYRPLCPTPTVASNVTRNNYCCFMPALPPVGASCVQDTAVPGCAPGRFGFACYGPDTPAQDYSTMNCPAAPSTGHSDEGYPATLYCCDFQ
jgi:hypothetical protein